MKMTSEYRKSERGAVAIIFGLPVVVLFAMGGVVLDLGHLYIAKAELQNAADAAALAGAKDLNETTPGINAAVATAQTISAKNKYNFSTDVTLALSNIEFGPSPDGPWSSVAAAQAAPQGKTFIKVDTGLKVLGTYLMRVAGIDTVSTSGVAVAGYFVVDVTPLGVCALDPVNLRNAMPGTNELVELGFRRGISYNIPELGPLGASGVPMLLNPVDSPPAACDPSHSSANFTAPFVCQGNSTIVGSTLQVYANTGYSAGAIERAFNSRLDEFPGGSACDPATSPPDINVKKYDYTLPPTVSPPSAPADWMSPAPIQQSISVDPITQKPVGFPGNPPTAANFGVLWSGSRAVQATGTTPTFTAGAPFSPADWPTLYNSGLSATSAYPTTAAIPPFPAGTSASPYNEIASGTNTRYFQQPPSPSHRPGTRNRRLMKLVIVDCSGLSGGGLSCATLPVRGIGRFFLQTRADLTGTPKKLYGEFAGLVEPVPISDIKLYR